MEFSQVATIAMHQPSSLLSWWYNQYQVSAERCGEGHHRSSIICAQCHSPAAVRAVELEAETQKSAAGVVYK